jgi:hypothetical protein
MRIFVKPGRTGCIIAQFLSQYFAEHVIIADVGTFSVVSLQSLQARRINYATTISFHVLSSTPFLNPAVIRRYSLR